MASNTVICAVTGETLQAEEALRVVLSPDGRWVPDLKQNLPAEKGECYLSFRREILEKALAQKLVTGDDLATLVAQQLEALALGALGLIKRSGQMIAGFEKVQAALKQRESGWGCLIHAADAADDGKAKLNRRAASGVPQCGCFSREQLTKATGIPNPVHVLVQRGALADRLLDLATKWQEWDENRPKT